MAGIKGARGAAERARSTRPLSPVPSPPFPTVSCAVPEALCRGGEGWLGLGPPPLGLHPGRGPVAVGGLCPGRETGFSQGCPGHSGALSAAGPRSRLPGGGGRWFLRLMGPFTCVGLYSRCSLD